VSFFALILRNTRAKPLRTVLTAIAVAVGVGAAITLGVVTRSLRQSAVSILEIGQADFSVTQKGVSDVLNSVLDEKQIAELAAYPEVQSTVGVLVATTDLDEDNPLFLEIGISPDKLEEFGVRLVDGRAYRADATDEVLLGYRAARNLDKAVGDRFELSGSSYTIVGIFSTGQAFGDSASMLPLRRVQAEERKPGDVTIAFVRVRDGADIDALRDRIEHDLPELVTVRTAEEFGRADRNLQLISAADTGATIVVLAVGVLIVANAMMLSFLERIREFGVLRAIGWSRARIVALVVGEALVLSVAGALFGVVLGVGATQLLERTSSLRGILRPTYDAQVFVRALWTAAGIGIVGALYPAMRAALIAPLEALRHE
jgi:putative ABC transport system permease protein